MANTSLYIPQTAGNLTGAVTSVGTLTTMNSALDALTDVTASTPAAADALIWDGSAWINLATSQGEVSYLNTTGTAITISAQSNGSTNLVKIAPATALGGAAVAFDNGGADDGRLRYIGTLTRTVQLVITGSFSPATANEQFVFAATQNGTPDVSGKVFVRARGVAEIAEFVVADIMTLATNDYIEIVVGNMTAAHNITVNSLQISAASC